MPRLPGPEQIPSRAGAARGRGGAPSVPALRVPGPARVPNLVTADPAGAAALGEIGAAVAGLAQRAQARDDTVGRTKARQSFTTSTFERINAFRDAGDPTDMEQLKSVYDEIAASRIDLVSQHQQAGASLDSLARLDTVLTDIETRAQTELSGLRITASRKLLEDHAASVSARLTLDAFNDPSQVHALAQRARQEVLEVSAGLPPEREAALQTGARAAVYEAGVRGSLIRHGREAALDMLNTPLVAEAMGAKRVLDLQRAIAAAPQPVRFMTTDEKTRIGFPSDSVVQIDGQGNAKVVFKPETDDSLRVKKIQDLIARGIDQNKAQDIVDGNIDIVIVPGLGVAREVNKITNEVREVPIGSGMAVVQAPPQGRTLWELARSGAIAGVVPMAKSVAGKTAGQIPGVPVATQTIQARQEIETATREIIRALSINPRFPVGEQERIRDEINIAPSMWDSERALLARMVGIKRSLQQRVFNERSTAANTALPQETRGFALQAANDIQNFLNRLGAPDEFDPSMAAPEGVPEFSTKIGVTRDGKDVWQSPDGKKWVIE